MTTLEQVQDNVASMDPFIPLSTTEQDTLARALDVFKAQKLAPCTACKYCMPCPPGSTFRACCTPGTNTACVVTASPP